MQGVNYQDTKAKTFSFFILQALQTYAAKRPERQCLLDDTLRMVAFNLTNKDPNSSLFKLTAQCYRFTQSSHLFDTHVRSLMEAHNYFNAARFAQHCGLVHPDFVHGFLVPLTFSRNQVSVVYDYLETGVGSALQVPLLSSLDTMMTSHAEEQFRDMMLRYGYKDIPRENLTYDYLRKNIPKLRKKMKIPLDATPNTHHLQNIGALEFWISRLAMSEAGE